MNKWIYILLLFSFNNLFGNNPEPIYHLSQVLYSVEYYQEQADLWEAITLESPQNEEAWYNYYLAAKHVTRLSKRTEAYDLEAIFYALEKSIPNTYTYHYMRYNHFNGADEYIEDAKKANEIDPNRYDPYPGLIRYYEMRRETQKVADYCKGWIESGKYSSGVLAWNYNVLMSVEENAILVTNGDNDTYPLWLLQYVKGIRTDVQVMNIHLMQVESYRNLFFEELNIPVYTDDIAFSNDPYLRLKEHLVTHTNHPIYFGTTTSQDFREANGNELYPVGLALKHAKAPFDNIAVLQHNYEQRFLLDYLKIDLEKDISSSIVNQLNLNYLPPFLLLHRHYKQQGEEEKAENLKLFSVRIAEKADQKEIIKPFLDEESLENMKTTTTLSIKKLERQFHPVKGKLYANETEITNEAYDIFLIDLLRNKEFELLDKCKTQKTDWRKKLPVEALGIADKIFFENGFPDNERMPLQNISYEAAQLYCQWLTRVYNNSIYKKKTFQEVVFRLPTEAEWEYAARGGRAEAPYPWGGYYCRNAKGCYLSNFNVTDGVTWEKYTGDANDGGYFTVPAVSYFPNDYGLYGMSGNVAEMVHEKGLAKGGSWEDTPDKCTIGSKKNYDKPSPAIGFRVFMEVIR